MLASTNKRYHLVIADAGGIILLTTDNKNGVFAGVDNDGVCSRFVHTKLKINIIVQGWLLPQIFCTIQQVNNSYKHIGVFGL